MSDSKKERRQFREDPSTLIGRFDDALGTLEVAISSLENTEDHGYPALIVLDRAFKELLAIYSELEEMPDLRIHSDGARQ